MNLKNSKNTVIVSGCHRRTSLFRSLSRFCMIILLNKVAWIEFVMFRYNKFSNYILQIFIIHCCRLQAVYSPITVKNFVTVYTAFNPCNRDQRIISSIKPNPMWQVQNPHWKSGQQTPSVGTLCLFREYGLNHIFLGIELFLLFRVESWNF